VRGDDPTIAALLEAYLAEHPRRDHRHSQSGDDDTIKLF
jgi:hypothetical protein